MQELDDIFVVFVQDPDNITLVGEEEKITLLVATGEPGPSGSQGERGPQGIQGFPGVAEDQMTYAKRIDWVTENLIYKGEAAVGTTEASSLWRIKKVVIGVDGDISDTWANGNANFDKQWTQRLVYVYS